MKWLKGIKTYHLLTKLKRLGDHQVEFCPHISKWIPLPFCFTFESSLDSHHSCLSLSTSLPFSAFWGFLFLQNRPPSEAGEGDLYPENIKAKTKNERELVQYHPTIEEVRGFWWINRCDAGTDGVCGASSPQTGGPYTKMASQPCHFHLPRRELARRRGEESGKMREPDPLQRTFWVPEVLLPCSVSVWMASGQAFVEKFKRRKLVQRKRGFLTSWHHLLAKEKEHHLLPNSRLPLLSIYGDFSDHFDPMIVQKEE